MQNNLYYDLLVRGVFESLPYNLVKNEIILNGYNTNYALKQYVKPFTYFMNLEGKNVK